jgi:hypothetical protein
MSRGQETAQATGSDEFARRQLALQPLFAQAARLLGQTAGLLLLAAAGSDLDRQKSHLRVARAQWRDLRMAYRGLESPTHFATSFGAVGITIDRLGSLLDRLDRRFATILREDAELATLLAELSATRRILQKGSCPHRGLAIVDLAGACCAAGH